jgi:SAM-dependent methyltransferase
MLELDRAVAAERNIVLKTVEASMDDLSALSDESFEIVIHPVSTCYVPDVVPVYREVARVLVAGGLYISQHKQPTSLQTSLDADQAGFRLVHPYYKTDPLPPSTQPNLIREEGTLEYIHRWEALLGEMCRAGLVIEDMTEPFHAKPDADANSFAHRCQFVAPYIRVKARRTGKRKTNLLL